MSQRILLTGSSGYAGGAIMRALQLAGMKIITAGRNQTDDVYFDLFSPEMLLKQNVPDNIDTYIHSAAVHEVFCKSNSISAYTANVVATRALIDMAINKKVKRLVYVSTFHVFSNLSGELNEATLPISSTDYGMSHLFAEELFLLAARQHNIEVKILRPANLFGIPANWSTFNRWTLAPFDFLKQAVENGKIVLHSDGTPMRNYVSLSHLGEAVVAAVRGDLPYMTHVTGREWSMAELAQLASEVVKAETGIDIPVVIGSLKCSEQKYEFYSKHWAAEKDDDKETMRYFLRTTFIHCSRFTTALI